MSVMRILNINVKITRLGQIHLPKSQNKSIVLTFLPVEYSAICSVRQYSFNKYGRASGSVLWRFFDSVMAQPHSRRIQNAMTNLPTHCWLKLCLHYCTVSWLQPTLIIITVFVYYIADKPLQSTCTNRITMITNKLPRRTALIQQNIKQVLQPNITG